MKTLLTGVQIGLIALYIEQALRSQAQGTQATPVKHEVPETIDPSIHPPTWLQEVVARINNNPQMPQCEEFVAHEWSIIQKIASYYLAFAK